MKELTIEEKAKRFDEAIKKLHEIITMDNKPVTPKEMGEFLFPELKESEDEKIRKEIIELVMQPTWKTEKEFHRRNELCVWLEKQCEQKPIISNNALREGITHFGITQYQIDNWLKKYVDIEKQGEQNQKHFELKAGHWYICHRAYCCRADHLTVKEGERFMCEKDGVVKGFIVKEPEKYFKEVCAPAPMEGEQNPTDKVEPKFHEGDWIVQEKIGVYKVIEVCESWYEVVDNKDKHYSIGFDKEYMCHLWTIQDAKDGDVLFTSYTASNEVFIFKGLTIEGYIECYCSYDSEDKYREGKYHFIGKPTFMTHPATKEQRDQLEKVMADAGYTFDFEKKELKKIEQNPTQEVKPFEAEHGKYYYCIKDYFCGGRKQASKGDVIQALRGLPIMGLKDASEYFLPVNFIKCYSTWSEEDEYIIEEIEAIIDAYVLEENNPKALIDWLKSLRPQNTWRPSDEQMLAINTAINVLGKGTINGKYLIELQEQLKKL